MRCTELMLTPRRPGHPAAPVQCVVSPGGRGERQADDALGDRGHEFRDARWPRLVAQKAPRSLQRRSALPAPDAGLCLAGLAHDGARSDTLGAQQNDLRPPHVLLRRVAVFDESLQPIKIGAGWKEKCRFASPRLCTPRPSPESVSGFNCQISSTNQGVRRRFKVDLTRSPGR